MLLLTALLGLLGGIHGPAADLRPGGAAPAADAAVQASRSVEPGPAVLSSGVVVPPIPTAERRATSDGPSAPCAPAGSTSGRAFFVPLSDAACAGADHRSAPTPRYHLHRALLI